MQQNITVIDVNQDFESIFTTKTVDLFDHSGMFISERQQALNFRYRKSKAAYQSDWHVAGDPTLIIVQAGCLQITLRNQQTRQFSSGDMFIAQDYLPSDVEFSKQHGHCAQVIGQDDFVAVHIKLSSLAP